MRIRSELGVPKPRSDKRKILSLLACATISGLATSKIFERNSPIDNHPTEQGLENPPEPAVKTSKAEKLDDGSVYIGDENPNLTGDDLERYSEHGETKQRAVEIFAQLVGNKYDIGYITGVNNEPQYHEEIVFWAKDGTGEVGSLYPDANGEYVFKPNDKVIQAYQSLGLPLDLTVFTDPSDVINILQDAEILGDLVAMPNEGDWQDRKSDLENALASSLITTTDIKKDRAEDAGDTGQ
ncbi:MAG: hypothetical protein V1898_03840 [Patescibacteria group bacterium]